MKRSCVLLLAALSLGVFLRPSPASAVDIVPFHTRNQSPVIAIYGLPPAGDPKVMPFGRTEVLISADLANNFAIDDTSREAIFLDGETHRFNLDLRTGLPDRFEAGIEVPYVSQEGGFLDHFIEDWHDFFDLPQGNRTQYPRDRLIYRYSRDGRTDLDITDSGSGLGDVRLFGGWQLYRPADRPQRAVALRASLKLPTGDSDRLLGSGSTDLAVWLTGGDATLTAHGKLAAFGALGVLYMTSSDVLPDQQRSVVEFGTLGAGWSPLDWLAFKLQFDGHTPFYRDSRLRELDDGSVQLTIGGTLGFTRNTSLDLGVSEDIVVKTAPDVVFHLALRTVF